MSQACIWLVSYTEYRGGPREVRNCKTKPRWKCTGGLLCTRHAQELKANLHIEIEPLERSK